MAHLLLHPRAKIADVQCTRLQFGPGDRVLVRVYHNLDRDQKKKLRRAVQKWTGPDVEILIINCLEMDLKIEKCKTNPENPTDIVTP